MATINPSSSYQRLVHQLSSQPPPACKSQKIDFEKIGLSIYKNCFAVLIDNVFSPGECKALLRVAQETHPWEQALVNRGAGTQALLTDVRLCERILWDDETVADLVMARVLPHLPDDIITLEGKAGITGRGPVKRKEQWRILRLNERLRFLKYTKGNYFREHCDGSYQSPEGDLTFLTVHLYLNGSDDLEGKLDNPTEDSQKPLVGGATRFFGDVEDQFWDLNPKTGSIVVFQHRDLLHSGEDVVQGTKYTLRSDVLYRKVT